MLRFLLGVVVGIVIGIMIVVPNPELGRQLDNAWDEGRRWVMGFVAEVEERVDEPADEAGEPQTPR